MLLPWLLLLIIMMIIINMSNILYTIQFFSLPEDRVIARTQAAIAEPGTHRFCKFCKTPEIDWSSRKVRTPGQEKIQTHWKEKDRFLTPGQPPFINWVWCLWHGIFPWASSAWLSVWRRSLPAPAHLLISWIWETGKSPCFHSNNWKHQRYQHSSHTKSKTQQLLEGKLILSQPKPGHSA